MAQFDIKQCAGGDTEQIIDGFSDLQSAKNTQLCFLNHQKHATDLKNTQAAAVLLPLDFQAATAPSTTCCLYAQDPQWLFCQIIDWCLDQQTPDQQTPSQPPEIRPSAVIHKTANIGQQVSVGHFTTVGQGSEVGDHSFIADRVCIGTQVKIGQGCKIHSGVVLYNHTQIGDNVTIHANAVIGADGFGYLQREGMHVKIPQIGWVVIENQVEIGANTCIDRAALKETRIKTGTKIDNLCQIGHGVSIGKHVIICAQSAIGGSAIIEDNVLIAGSVSIRDHCHIGESAVLLGGSIVIKNVPKNQHVFGHPAQEKHHAFKQIKQMAEFTKTSFAKTPK